MFEPACIKKKKKKNEIKKKKSEKLVCLQYKIPEHDFEFVQLWKFVFFKAKFVAFYVN